MQIRFLLLTVLERHINVRRKTYCRFVDLQKTSNTMNKLELWHVLCEYEDEGWLLKAVRMI